QSSGGCLPSRPPNALKRVAVPRSLTPNRTLGFGGTRVIAGAGAADSPRAAVASTAIQLGVLQDIAHPPRLDSERLRVGGAALADHRDLHQLGLLPGCKHGLPCDGAGCKQSVADERQRQ